MRCRRYVAVGSPSGNEYSDGGQGSIFAHRGEALLGCWRKRLADLSPAVVTLPVPVAASAASKGLPVRHSSDTGPF